MLPREFETALQIILEQLTGLPSAPPLAAGEEPFIILGAIAGG